jgi:hypothetical protein
VYDVTSHLVRLLIVDSESIPGQDHGSILLRRLDWICRGESESATRGGGEAVRDVRVKEGGFNQATRMPDYRYVCSLSKFAAGLKY